MERKHGVVVRWETAGGRHGGLVAAHGLERALAGLDPEWRRRCHAPPAPVGEEAALAICLGPAAAVRLGRRVQEAALPGELRVAVVEGRIDVGWALRRAERMDGPALRRAARLLKRGRRSTRRWRLALAPERETAAVEALLELLYARRATMTPFQLRCVELALEGRTRKEVAGLLGRAPQQAAAALRSVRFEVLRCGEEALEARLAGWEAPGGA